ncbi:fimbria/pilus outer membrane usher protein [Cysteiniphilum sp. JM-1]|uniref:fimbria/pilus outer membrane usher protein n=1 Tax=Cysteiniphilum sp. JM-1 TaxID=2610891 RepID=UPI001244E94F|nr:fimbria/pilus outer membrane usher protein [Cysteiniphilum sp. JM-1]
MQKKILYIVYAAALVPMFGGAAPKFDTSFFNDFNSTDANMLSGKLSPGLHVLTLKLNGRYLGVYSVQVINNRKHGFLLQLTENVINKFHAKKSFLNALKVQGYKIGQDNLKYVKYHYDASNQSVDISVPQAYLYTIRPGDVAPASQWQFGINGGAIHYNINGASSYTTHTINNSFFTSIFAKYNLGDWQFYTNWNAGVSSSNGSGSQTSKVMTNQNFSYTYATTILPSIKSRLMIGYNSINSALFGGGSFYGLTLNNELQMLPQDQQSFKPVVQGVAQEPITLELYQQGKLIYKTQLNPGPYEISNYNASSAQGDITEVITTTSGKKTKYTLPYQIVNEALFPGVYEYALNAGYLENHYSLSPLFLEGELRYGLNNFLTPYVGAFLNKNYISQGLGTTLNLGEFGGVSLESGYSIFHSDAKYNMGDSRGFDAQITYYKSLDYIGTSFNVVGYLYESKGYTSLGDAQDSSDINLYHHVKNQVQLSINQSLGNQFNINLAADYKSNWDGTSSVTENGTLSYYVNQYFNMSLNYQQSNDLENDLSQQIDRSISLTFNFNLGNHSFSNTLGYDQTDNNIQNNLRYNYNSSSGKYNAGLGVTTADQLHQQSVHDAIANSSINGNIGIDTNNAYFNANASLQNKGDYSLSGSMIGAIVYTPETGVILSRDLDNTFAVIDTEGVAGVSTGYNQTTDSNGYGISSDLMPYSYNNIILKDTQRQNGVLLDYQAYAVPVEGAILYKKFKSKVGQPLFILLDSKYKTTVLVKDITSNSMAEHVYGQLYYLPTARPFDKIMITKNNKLLQSKTLPAKLPQQLTLLK